MVKTKVFSLWTDGKKELLLLVREERADRRTLAVDLIKTLYFLSDQFHFLLKKINIFELCAKNV